MTKIKARKGLSMIISLSILFSMLPIKVLAAIPANPPSGAAFTDADTNQGQISGDFTWNAAIDETDITDYKIYFLDGLNVKVGEAVATVAKGGANTYNFPQDTVIPIGATQIVVYSYNVDGEETTGSKVSIVDDDSNGIEITGFDAIAPVDGGTVGSPIYADVAAVQAALPLNVAANSGAATVPVTGWVDTDSYNPAVAGSYTFTATLGALPEGFANTGNYTATVEVVVLPNYVLSNTDITAVGGFKKTTVTVTKGTSLSLSDARLLIVGERASGGQACWVIDAGTNDGDGFGTEISVTNGAFTTIKVYLIDGVPNWSSPFTGVKANILTINP